MQVGKLQYTLHIASTARAVRMVGSVYGKGELYARLLDTRTVQKHEMLHLLRLRAPIYLMIKFLLE